ncbi:MAG: hypothetical protein EXR27_06760 [Betaproteobacteria bacterium]|nr:hypothetical protein [Betaproteobacteria bacterium]
MTSTPIQPAGVHLVGSIPLEDSKAVFQLIGRELGRHVCRIPDGETGIRKNWITGQFNIFAGMPQFEKEAVMSGPYKARPRLRIKDGVRAEEIVFSSLGYADAAIASYAEFCRQKEAGVIPKGVRFMVCLPTPLAPVQSSFLPECQAVVEQAYETRMLTEVDQMAAAIPSEELAIQWDVAIEFAIIEGVMPSHMADPEKGSIESLVRIGNRVPRAVELGYHLCYGDFGHKHFKEPTDTKIMVRVSNGVIAGLARPLQFIHLPVPRDRSDDAYFAPLAELRLPAETELYLGLVHITGGVEGTRKRIDTARRYVAKFGIGTECGMSRRPADTIPALLDIHVQAAQPIGQS